MSIKQGFWLFGSAAGRNSWVASDGAVSGDVAYETGTDTWAVFNGSSWDELYAAPVDVGNGVANVEGTSGLFARADHVHKVLLQIQKAGVTQGTRHYINFVEGDGITITTTDDAGNDRVDVEISATGSNTSVRVVGTSGTLSTDFENGDTVDGVTLSTGDRFLYTGGVEAGAVENGIYTVNVSGAPSRAADMPVGDAVAGRLIVVEEGTTYADTIWLARSDAGLDVVGTDGLDFGIYAGKAGGTIVNVNAAISDSGTSVFVAKADHKHGVDTAAPAADLTPSTTNSEGSADTLARSDHGHNLPTAAPSGTLGANTANSEGAAESFARSNHVHAIDTSGTIQPVDSLFSGQGLASGFARTSHTHAHGSQTNPEHHALVSSARHGFFPRSNLNEADDPDWNDDNTPSGGVSRTEGSLWLNNTYDAAFILLDDTDANAKWQKIAKACVYGAPVNDLKFALNPADPNCVDGSSNFVRNIAHRTNTQLGSVNGNTLLRENAFDYDGVSGDITFVTSTDLDDVFAGGGTAMVWANPASDGGSSAGRMLSKESSGGVSGWSLYFAGQDSGSEPSTFCVMTFLVRMTTGSPNYRAWNSDYIPVINTWGCFAMTWDQSSPLTAPEMWWNGRPLTVTLDGSSGAGTVATSDASNDLVVGNRNGDNRTYDGFIGVVLVWGRVLTDEEIRRAYYATKPLYSPPTAQLLDVIEVDSGVTDVSFDNLTGETDGYYRMFGRAVEGISGGGSWSWEPNNLTTNQASNHYYHTSTPALGGGTATTLQFLRMGTIFDNALFDVLISPAHTKGDTANRRTYQGYASTFDSSSVQRAYHFYGQWTDTSTEITSIEIHTDVSGGIGAGSQILLYRLNDAQEL